MKYYLCYNNKVLVTVIHYNYLLITSNDQYFIDDEYNC